MVFNEGVLRNFATFVLSHMKKANSIGSIVRMVVICFLFFSFISSSLNLTANGKVFIGLFSIKKVKGPSHTDAGCPMEEVGKEVESRGEEKGNYNLFLLCSAQNFVLPIFLDAGAERTIRSGPSHGDTTGVPIYLAYRTLLI